MARGTVKFFSVRRGFGFIIPEPSDGKEIYFSRASLPRDRRYDPVEGDPVEFDVRSSPQGPMAVRIELQTVQP